MPHSQHNIPIDIPVEDGEYNIEPVIFGYQDCPPGHYFGPTVRTYWLIHYIVSGQGIFRIGGVTYTVGKGMMFVIPPYVETFYQTEQDDPWSYIWVGFQSKSDLPVTLDPVIHCPHAGAIFQSMKNCREYESGRSMYLCSRLWDLFAVIKERDISQMDPVMQALQVIRAEYMTDISVQQLAERVCLDRSYFSSVFKQRIGISPGRYLLKYRMDCAMELLREYNCSVTVTANSVGYNDVYTFSKMFKRYHGFSPSAVYGLRKGGDCSVSATCGPASAAESK